MADDEVLRTKSTSDIDDINNPASSNTAENANNEAPTTSEPVKPATSSQDKASPTESSSSSNFGARLPNIYSKFVASFENALSQITDEPTLKRKLSSFDLEGIAKYIKTRNVRNIIFMVGAGISTSAGVPDFRSPRTGLYDNLKKYNLPDPQAIFELSFFKNNPMPFYQMARELFPGTLKPTPCHYFMRLLDEKGYVRRIYTQNIDSLEYVTQIPSNKIIAAHGSHQTSTCLKCKKIFDLEWITDFLRQTKVIVPRCSCGGLIKPCITFFGENLPSNFFTSAVQDFPKCDLLLIIGTSLVVQPFASMIHEVNEDTPRLLLNLEPVGTVSRYGRAQGLQGLSYNDKDNIRDVFCKTAADDGCIKLAELLGLKDELNAMILAGHARINKTVQELDEKNAKKLDTKSKT